MTQLGLTLAAAAAAQSVPTSRERLSFVIGAGTLSPAPYWQGRWSTWGPSSRAKTPTEVSGAVRLALSHGKSIEFGISRWRVRVSSEVGDPFSGYFESVMETQDVRAFEVNWLKRIGSPRAALLAGGGMAISNERHQIHVTTRGCALAPCEQYDRTDHHVAAAVGQGLAGLDLALTKRLRAHAAYRVQARNVAGFEFGGWYHGITGGLSIAIH